MKLTQEFICRTIEEILVRLTLDVYNIPKSVFDRMKRYVKCCEVQLLLNGNIGAAKVKEKIQSGPDGVVTVRPFLYIVQEDSQRLQSILFHELMHLLSIGDCFRSSDTTDQYFHRSGLDEYEIQMSNSIVPLNRCAFLNELLNDAIAAFLFTSMYNKPYYSNPRFSCLKFRDYLMYRLEQTKKTPEELIGYYLSHNDEGLRAILLQFPDEDFSALDRELYKSYLKSKSYMEFRNDKIEM